MKSCKQRRSEIKQKRLRKAAQQAKMPKPPPLRPKGAVDADVHLLEQHNNSYHLPEFYLDKPFTCIDCGTEEVWTAQQQKWWYETILANINTTAVRCHACRRKKRAARIAQRVHMAEMAQRQPHPNEAFFRKRYRA